MITIEDLRKKLKSLEEEFDLISKNVDSLKQKQYEIKGAYDQINQLINEISYDIANEKETSVEE